jgi:hypothetical protein
MGRLLSKKTGVKNELKMIPDFILQKDLLEEWSIGVLE